MNLVNLLASIGLASTLFVQGSLDTAYQSNALTHSSMNSQRTDNLYVQQKKTSLISSMLGRRAYLDGNGNLKIFIPVWGSSIWDLDSFLQANYNLRVRDSSRRKVEILSMRRGNIYQNRVLISIYWKGWKKIKIFGWRSRSGKFDVNCNYWTTTGMRYLSCPIPDKIRKHIDIGYFPIR